MLAGMHSDVQLAPGCKGAEHTSVGESCSMLAREKSRAGRQATRLRGMPPDQRMLQQTATEQGIRMM